LLTGSIWAGVIIQATLFAFGHGYQGPALMVGIFGLGLIFGITTKLRKSVRPAMFAHAWIDFFSGVAGYIAFAMHFKIPLK
jgi:membrane protease YdiL (CAAX protease family)